MSKIRHKKNGGVVPSDPSPKDVYAGAESNVVKEAKERKHGGPVEKKGEKIEGGKTRMRLDRPGRKMGGRVGADAAPLSSAARVTDRIGG
ncbi:MAG: hypothetical protein J0I45_16305 [Bosea sp.]|nr:hypothetical protein [Bosea sp. (in: a-proteobacteria)]